MDNVFGIRLKEMRNSRNISQKEFAEEIGTSESNVSKWESGKSTPPTDTIKKIAKYYNRPISYFFGEDSQRSGSEKLYNELVKEGLISNDMSDEEMDKIINKIVAMYKLIKE